MCAMCRERLDVDNDQNPALEVAWNNAVAKPAGQRNYYEKNVVGAVAQVSQNRTPLPCSCLHAAQASEQHYPSPLKRDLE